MSNIRWPSILQTNDSVDSLVSGSGFWIASPTILEMYPMLHEKSPFLVQRADFETLLRLQQNIIEANPASVYAIGGGKVLDLVKLALRLGRLNDASAEQLLLRQWVEGPCLAVPLTVIPTTAGSGSEVSEVAVLTINSCKIPLHHTSLLPDQVIVNLNFMRNLPKRVLWNGLWDTFIHALESVLSPLATASTKTLSWDVLRTTVPLIDSLQKTDSLTEEQCILLQRNNILAGKAQSVASVGLAHALAHQAESALQWHGEACARVIPRVTALNAVKAPEKYEELSRQCGKRDYMQFAEWLEMNVRQTVGEFIPSTNSREHHIELVKRIMKDPCYRTNVAYISKAELTEWLERWYYE